MMGAPAALIECEPVITGTSTVWTFFRTDIDGAGQGHGRIRLAEFTSPKRAKEFGLVARTGGCRVQGLDHIVSPAPLLTLTETAPW